MKKSVLLTFLLATVFAFGQGIKFEDSNWTSMLAKAKQENKLIFVDAYAVWCGPCKLMVKNIFPLKSVGDIYNAQFINAKIDMEKGEGIDLAKKYNVRAFPTYLFINGDGEEVHRTLGYVPEGDFIQFAKDAADPTKRLTALKSKFENGETEPAFLLNLAKLTVYNDTPFADRVLGKYFAPKTELTQENMQYLLTGMKSTGSESYKVFTDRKDDIVKMITEKNYENIDKNVKVNSILAKAYNADTKKTDEAYFLAETQKFMTKDEADKLLKRVNSSNAFKNKDYATYAKLNMEMYKDYSAASSAELNSVAWNFFEKVEDKAALQMAVKWAEESVKKDESYANTDTVANLHNKIGDKKNAKMWAEKAIELGKKAGEDTADTEKILKTL